MTKKSKALLEIKEKGYTVNLNGEIISPYTNKVRKMQVDDKGYLRVSFRLSDNTHIHLRVHRYVGYLKFGDKVFDPELHVRHLDNNQKNNSWDNIGIGTASENELDKFQHVRTNSALSGSLAVKVHDHEQIIADREGGMTYADIMYKHNISSKGTVSFIINKSHSLKK